MLSWGLRELEFNFIFRVAPVGSSFKVGGCYAGLNLDKMGVKAYFGFDVE